MSVVSSLHVHFVTSFRLPYVKFEYECFEKNRRPSKMTNSSAIGTVLIQAALYFVSTKDPSQSQLNVTLLEESVPSPLFANESIVCYGMYGCFSKESPWVNNKSRPITEFPAHPSTILPTFCLKTRYNSKECQFLDYTNRSSIFRSYYTPYHKTYVIAHGFLDNGEKPWVLNIVRSLLRNENANVIVVDWGLGSSPPYSQAVANIRLIGRMTAILIYTLKLLTGTKTEDFHIIGHSLGAHLSGYAGYTLKHFFNCSVGRITGMDPAQPHFTGTLTLVRLDHSDALFVDVIHTNTKPFVSGGFGILEPIGHLDFYPNNGDNQPGCSGGMMVFVKNTNSSVYHGMRQYLSCDHIRSHEFLLDSINKTKGRFMSVECESWENFLLGECFPCQSKKNPEGRYCAHLGLPAYNDWINTDESIKNAKSPLKLYTITRNKTPFYATLYRVNVKISNSTESILHRGEIGVFSIRIVGTKGETNMVEVIGERYFAPGSSHQQVIGDEDVGVITSVKLHWVHKTTMNILTWRIDPIIYIESVLVETFLDNQRLYFCPVNDQVLSAHSTMNMRPCER